MKTVTASKLAELQREAAEKERRRTNYNLHEKLEDPIQRLCIVGEPDTVFPPHRHLDKWELVTPLKGSFTHYIYNDQGEVVERYDMKPGGDTVVLEIPAGTWHNCVFYEPGTTFLEVKRGPYMPFTPEELAPFPGIKPEGGKKMSNTLPALLLHVCCAPCASACVERLLAEGRQITLYFSNSNIISEAEYQKRLNCVKRLAAHHNLELVIDPYDHESWKAHVSTVAGFELAPEGGARCVKCFEWSLGRAAAEAEKRGMNFCTTLTVSPHKNANVIFAVGRHWDRFEAYDFKKKDGFKRSLELSAQFGFYRQSFCGCEYSQRGEESHNTVCQ